MSEVVKNRSEIVFLYDVTNANPNGDPVENMPRMDEEWEINLVSDTRFKRTIRDYLEVRRKENPAVKGNEISVLPIRDEENKIKTKGQKISEIVEQHPEFLVAAGKKKKVDVGKLEGYLKETFIDLRLFGATLALGEEAKAKADEAGVEKVEAGVEDKKGTDKSDEKSNTKKGIDIPSMKWIGPVQFKFGHSLHKVEPVTMKGTSVESSGVGKAMGTFTEFHYVPYSLIAFYGVVNEANAANTGLTDEDVSKLLEAIWGGTNDLTTRSKVGQVSRFLMQVVYKGHFHVGNLEAFVSLTDQTGNKLSTDDKRGKSLRSINQVKIDLRGLVARLKEDVDRVPEVLVHGDVGASFIIQDETVESKDGKEPDAVKAPYKSVTGKYLVSALQEAFGPKVKVKPIFGIPSKE